MADKINNKTVTVAEDSPLWLNMSAYDDGTLDVVVMVEEVGEVAKMMLNIDDMSYVVDEISVYIKEITNGRN